VPLGDPDGLHQRAVSARSLAERLRRHPTQWAQEWADRTLVKPRRCIVAGCTALAQCSHGPALSRALRRLRVARPFAGQEAGATPHRRHERLGGAGAPLLARSPCGRHGWGGDPVRPGRVQTGPGADPSPRPARRRRRRKRRASAPGRPNLEV
jgi:hypothetical protein